jgi:hypothetical protein
MPITAVEKATPMNHYTAPYGINSVMDRWRYRQEWQRWLAEQAFDRFVTLNFNRDTTPAGARRTLGRFLAQLDRRFLGRRWCEKGPERTFGVAVLENQETNLHLHMALHLPAPTAALSFGEQQLYLESTWGRLVVGGQCDVLAVYDRAGVADYMAKQLTRPGYAETFILSTEFHNT